MAARFYPPRCASVNVGSDPASDPILQQPKMLLGVAREMLRDLLWDLPTYQIAGKHRQVRYKPSSEA